MSINKITRADYPNDFDNFIDDFIEISYEDHRRGSSFYRSAIIKIDAEWYPLFPELWGHWETNMYVWDDNYGTDRSEINVLSRVEKREKIVKTYEWVPVEDAKDQDSGELPTPK